MMYEFKIKKEIRKGIGLLVTEPCSDNYLIQFERYLMEHRNRIPRILEILDDETVEGYGGNQMYTEMEGPVIFIHDGYDDDPEEFGIRINRSDLIEIFKAWLELNVLMEPHGGIKEIILQRDEKHITMIGYYEDGFEFRRTFNYKVK